MNEQFERYFGILASILTILGFLITLFLLPSEYKMLGFIVTLIIFQIFFFYIAYYFGKSKGSLPIAAEENPKQKFIVSLLEFLKRMKEENENAEIIRFGVALSKPLWLSQNYKTRKIVGDFIYDAAINSDNKNVMIKALIDDIGWTQVELGHYDKSEKKITRGLELAKLYSNGYYLAKGYRHLFGLYFRRGLLEKAENYLLEAIKFTNDFDDGKKKDELVAEIHFAKSSLEHKKGNLEESLKEIELAEKIYCSLPNKEWLIKILARKGEILISKNEIDEAYEIFTRGLEDSRKYHFNRQIVKNLIGLGKCKYEYKNIDEAKEYFDKAFFIANEIGMYYEKSLVTQEIEKINNL